jgi:hypothetical protein
MKILQRFWPGPLSLGAFAMVTSTAEAPNGVKIDEGTVTRVDPGRKRITIKFAKGGTETLHSDNSFTANSSRVIVHYADESGRQVARFFKPAHQGAYP